MTRYHVEVRDGTCADWDAESYRAVLAAAQDLWPTVYAWRVRGGTYLATVALGECEPGTTISEIAVAWVEDVSR